MAAESSFHYGWVVVCTGTLCIMACLGFGRFALGMLLPSMGATLGLSYSEMGFISTGNFAGYLVAVLGSSIIMGQVGARRLIVGALLVVGSSMALVSRAESFYEVLVLYTLTGIGSGAANVPVMGLASAWFKSRKRGRAAGFIVIGSGFAIIISGRMVPAINRTFGAEGWRVSWLIISLAVFLIAAIAYLLIRDRPEEKGLRPVGADDVSDQDKPVRSSKDVNIYRSGVVYFLGFIYFLFGYTYVIYATFIVTTLIKERGFSESVAGSFWSWVGLLSLFSGPVFGTLSDKLGRKAGLSIVFLFQTLAYFLVASGLPGTYLYLSIFFYGIVAWSIPSIMAAASGDYAGSKKAAAAFGFITFIFGFGQISGPAVAGVIAEKTGGFTAAFYMAAACAVLAAGLSLFLPRPSGK